MIYFIQAGENKPIKIGWTENIAGRYDHLQTAHYEELKIRKLFEGDKELESKIHYAARKHRIRNEWYRAEVLGSNEVYKIIKNEKKIRLPDYFRGRYDRKLKQIFVRELRETKKWTQEKLASELNVSVQTIIQWENGKQIHIKHKQKLKQIFKKKEK